MRGRHDPPIVDERSTAEDEDGLGRGLRGQSHLPRDLALVRVLAAHNAGVAQGRATANLGGSFLVQDYLYLTSSTHIIKISRLTKVHEARSRNFGPILHMTSLSYRIDSTCLNLLLVSVGLRSQW